MSSASSDNHTRPDRGRRTRTSSVLGPALAAGDVGLAITPESAARCAPLPGVRRAASTCASSGSERDRGAATDADGQARGGSASAPANYSADSSASANASTVGKRFSRVRAIPRRSTACTSSAGHGTYGTSGSGWP